MVMGSGLVWVPGGHQVCQQQGCQIGRATDMMSTAAAVGKVAQMMEVEDVALWCGVGGHAFSGRDPGRQRVTVEQWDEDLNRMAPVSVSACGEHARPLALKTRPAAAIRNGESVTDPAEAHRRGYDPAYVAWLEQQRDKTDGD
jgi:hypothetical protein